MPSQELRCCDIVRITTDAGLQQKYHSVRTVHMQKWEVRSISHMQGLHVFIQLIILIYSFLFVVLLGHHMYLQKHIKGRSSVEVLIIMILIHPHTDRNRHRSVVLSTCRQTGYDVIIHTYPLGLIKSAAILCRCLLLVL